MQRVIATYSSVTDLAFYHVCLWSCSLILLAFTHTHKKNCWLTLLWLHFTTNSICHKNWKTMPLEQKLGKEGSDCNCKDQVFFELLRARFSEMLKTQNLTCTTGLYRKVSIKVSHRTLDAKIWELKRKYWKSSSFLWSLNTNLRC